MKPLALKVRLQQQDIRDFIFAKYRSKTKNWILFFAILFFLISIICGLFIAGILYFYFGPIPSVTPFFSISLVTGIFLLFFAPIPLLLEYVAHMQNFRQSPLLARTFHYKINSQGIGFLFDGGTCQCSWDDIIMVEEFKPCFIVSFGIDRYMILPRRCFSSEQEIAIFIGWVVKELEPARRQIMRYHIKPWEKGINVLPMEDTIEPSPPNYDDNPLLELRFSLKGKDCLRYSFQTYYGGLRGIAGALLVVFFASIILWTLNSSSDLGIVKTILIISAGLGITLAVFPPLAYVVQAGKAFASRHSIDQEVVYRFYPDYYYAADHFEHISLYWAELHQVIEKRGFFAIYNTAQVVQIIPKHAFASKTEEAAFRKICRSAQDQVALRTAQRRQEQRIA